MEPSFWDSRYGEEEYVYGREPNVHVRQTAELYLNASPCHIVELACGEGRNVAYLVAAGHRVTAVDFSHAGLDKTVRLAAERAGSSAAARVNPVKADVLTWRPPGGPGSVDCVVLSFCHVPSADRPAFMAGIVEMLRPGGSAGGLLIMEVFHPNQIHKGYRQESGGPHDPDLLVTLQELRNQLGQYAGTELLGQELEYVLERAFAIICHVIICHVRTRWWLSFVVRPVEDGKLASLSPARRTAELWFLMRPYGLELQGQLPSAPHVNLLAETLHAQTLAESAPHSVASIPIVGSQLGTAEEPGAAASVYVAAQASSSASASRSTTAAVSAASFLGPTHLSHPVEESLNTNLSTSANTNAEQQQQQQQTQQGTDLWKRIVGAVRTVHWGKLWALALLFVSYVHQATTGFALPAMLPMISNELHLDDMQEGALLTTGYSYLYAVALVPIGLLADRVSRPQLLAAGLALWSVLTCTASTCRSFGELMLARVGFAAAQGAQNPVCFSLIPELFPVNKSTALSLYNCAIYVGRALSFAAVLLARHLHDNDQAHLAARGGLRMETRLDHLDRADLHSLSIMHTAGDMAAATPDKEFNFPLWEYGNELPDSAWRQVLRWIAIPGFLIGLAMATTLQEPRQAAVQQLAAAPPAPAPAVVAGVATPPAAALTGAAAALPAPPLLTSATQDKPADAPAAAAAATAAASGSNIMALLRSPGFMSVTLAAALNDVGSYALIAWQSTFYERVYNLEPPSYAPVLAALLPIGGILGGVGGGYLADRLSAIGRRGWVTAGATCVAAPCLAASCLAPTAEFSYAALLVGFALSEMWRAPSAVMARCGSGRPLRAPFERQGGAEKLYDIEMKAKNKAQMS
ncbi:hypothetical protein VOLCADRAFT_95577 [Volvox carteri f. nagariensis]|uniref:Methyltransferase domain-containing protein n=1 Tax=Volvox carteri f. nagariensis TaxID=3068 RepID=D8U7Z5_VOLCA|nr:uncharacterized protein VOLCADRAFT_95577 [Volvox carteri f. nagariensis]EFJ44126.1 hypothetical protein VOLCADRAFT_95577 [Volvox carteri f. nagariensis]|eukprot:XP_002954720.1 hypothetical protein VOLCADRAFT_95577 [Volvox carteri f. nagariensis]